MGDLISREAAIVRVSKLIKDDGLAHDVKEALKEIPSVKKAGRWVRDDPFIKPICSECGEPCIGLHGFDYTLTDYCPNCGAKMGEIT